MTCTTPAHPPITPPPPISMLSHWRRLHLCAPKSIGIQRATPTLNPGGEGVAIPWRIHRSQGGAEEKHHSRSTLQIILLVGKEGVIAWRARIAEGGYGRRAHALATRLGAALSCTTAVILRPVITCSPHRARKCASTPPQDIANDGRMHRQCPYSAHTVPTQCPHSAHTVPTQCPHVKHWHF